MRQRLRLAAALLLLSLTCFPAPVAAQTDFALVGRAMGRILQNGHYSRPAFDVELSQKFFEEYLETLDPSHVYFLQSDIKKFRKQYSHCLHELLMTSDALSAGAEIFEVYRIRVKARIGEACALLEKNDFKFDGDRTVILDRSEEPWPADEERARALWKLRVEQALLSELIRREEIDQRAKEQGKESPFLEAPSAIFKVKSNYDRVLKKITDSDFEFFVWGVPNFKIFRFSDFQIPRFPDRACAGLGLWAGPGRSAVPLLTKSMMCAVPSACLEIGKSMGKNPQ